MRLYIHQEMRDVAIEIVKSFYVKEKELWKFKVVWWNVGRAHEAWCMNLTQRIEVSKKDWANKWRLYKREEHPGGRCEFFDSKLFSEGTNSPAGTEGSSTSD